MDKNKYLPWMAAAGLAAIVSLAVGLPAFAQTQPGPGVPGMQGGWGGMHGGTPGIFGTVSAVDGTTLTVAGKMRTSTVYTVDASQATVMKNGTSSTVADIVPGDTVMVQGTVSGTSVTATMIRDGMGGMRGKGFGRTASSTPRTAPIQGNGEPVIAGSVTAINNSTLTVANASNVTYTVDASNAKIVKNGTTTALSDVATGDAVVVQGTVNGTLVVASSVVDQGSKSSATGGTLAGGGSGSGGFGFFGMIGNFFKHLFGF